MTNDDKKTVLWIIDGSLRDQLHKNARLKPAQELAKQGWRVTMVTAGVPEGTDFTSIDLVTIHWPDHYIVGAISYYYQILKRILSGRIKANIVFFQMDSIAVCLLAIPLWQIITSNKRMNVVADLRSLPMDTASIKGKLRSLFFYLGILLIRSLKVKVTAITQQIVEVLKIKEEQLIGIWPSGVDLSEFENCYKNRKWPDIGDPIRLIYLGVMTEERNLISVIEAARIARDKGVNLKLSLVGAGPQKDKLQRLAKQQGNDLITISGPFPYNIVPEVLSKHDIGILPFPNVSKMKVSSAIKMFEYIAAGMPVIATKIQAHEKVFNNSRFVFWCDESSDSIASAMHAVYRSKQHLSSLGYKAREYSNHWSWEKSALKLSGALKKQV